MHTEMLKHTHTHTHIHTHSYTQHTLIDLLGLFALLHAYLKGEDVCVQAMTIMGWADFVRVSMNVSVIV